MKTAKNFALIGAAGYVAPRHMQAIQDTGNQLVVAMDPNDSVGVIDNYFPKAAFFVEFERFDRFVDRARREKHGKQIDYVSICSPNYMHDAHIRFALRNEAHAICEKPLVLNPWNVDALAEVEQETGRQIYTILQLRLHPAIVALREKVLQADQDKVYDVDLSYITSRGVWYHVSWKGDLQQSGGVVTNIGVHFFDMLVWIFGGVKSSTVFERAYDRASGVLELGRARVNWLLSVNAEDLPDKVQASGQRTYRSIQVAGEDVEFSDGFTDLHTKSYADILAGRGYGVEDARAAIEIVHDIRNAEVTRRREDYHPLHKGGSNV